MRIGIDATTWINRRGFGRFTRELLNAIAALKTGDEFVLLADRGTVEQAHFPPGWQVLVGETKASPAEAASADGRRSIRDVRVMRRLAGRERFDVFFFPAVYSYFPLSGTVPCLVTFHDAIAETLPHLIFHTRRSRFFWNLKCKLAVRRAARIVTVSQASKQGLMNAFGLQDEKMRVVSEAASPNFGPIDRTASTHRDALARYNMTGESRYLLYVGGISPHKNLGTLLEGFDRIKNEPGTADVKLLLVGDYKGDVFRTCHAELMRLVDSRGLSDRVRFLGFIPDDDLVHLYAASQAFVFPSFLEGFGLPAVEAMSSGAAVLASNRGSLPEVVGEAGCLFDPDDANDLARAMKRVLMDDTFRADLQTRSLARAKDFSWSKSAEQTMNIFREFNP